VRFYQLLLGMLARTSIDRMRFYYCWSTV